MAKLKEIFGPNNHAIRRTLLTGAAFILGFILLGVITIQVWEYSNSVAFCTNACHDVHPEEPVAYQDFYHASVKCTDPCHLAQSQPLSAFAGDPLSPV